MLLFDGICSQIITVLTGGALLVGFALQLGASNVVIGILASLGPLSQMLQIPLIFLIERTRMRKASAVLSTFSSRLFWLLIAAIPWMLPTSLAVPVLLGSLLLSFGIGAISNLAFGSWMRDFIPDPIRGRYTGRRMAVATALGAVLSLLAGMSVDVFRPYFPEQGIYSIIFLLAAGIGFLGAYFLSQIPEPIMQPTPPRSILHILREPFQDRNFRRLLIFLGAWNFATNLAAPFFTVYMLKRIGLSMTLVLVLSVLSQGANVMFFQLWGRLADRFSNKSALMQAGPLFILSIFLFPFTTMPETYVLTLPLLFLIHALAGMSSAGRVLCTGNIAIKLAPQGKATSYLATNALISGIAATIAPILGGIGADWFARRELDLTFTWMSGPAYRIVEFLAMSLRGLDFLFMLAVVLGLYSLHRLALVQEYGEAEEEIVVEELYGMVRRAFRSVSNVAGVRYLFEFPYGRLLEMFSEDNLPEDSEHQMILPGLFDPHAVKKTLGLEDEREEDI